MDPSTAASTPPSTSVTGTITTVHLGLIALFAIVAIAAIVWGIRLRRARKAGDAELEERGELVRLPAEGTGGTTESAPDAAQAPTSGDRQRAPEAVEREAPPPVAYREERGRDGGAGPAATEDETPAGAEPADGGSLAGARAPDGRPAPVAAPALTAAPVPTAAPAPIAAPAPVTAPAGPSGGAGVALTQLKGLGPKAATRLGELGITSLDQLARLSDDEAGRLDAQLGPFQGRLARDRWVEQAQFLSRDDRAGYEAVFGKL